MGFDTHIAATVTFFLVGVGGVMGFSLAYVAWRRGETPSSRQYAGLMAASGVWCALYAFVLGSPSFRLATWVYPLITATMIVTAIQWLRFSAEYTGYADRIPR